MHGQRNAFRGPKKKGMTHYMYENKKSKNCEISIGLIAKNAFNKMYVLVLRLKPFLLAHIITYNICGLHYT